MTTRSTPITDISGYAPFREIPDAGFNADKIDRPRPTRDQIFDRILDDVVSLRLKPGEPVLVKELATRFGVSRSPVREAIIRLTDAGLLEIYPQSGTRVAPICMNLVRRMYFVRTAIEMALVEALAGDHRPDHIAALREIVERQSTCADDGDLDAFYRLDEQFHQAIAAYAGFPGIWDTVDGQKAHMDRLRHLVLPLPARLREIIGEHGSIIDGIERGDSESARRAMAEHLKQVLRIQEVLNERFPDYFE